MPATQENVLAEFKDLLKEIAAEVSASAVLPAVEVAQSRWTEQLSGIKNAHEGVLSALDSSAKGLTSSTAGFKSTAQTLAQQFTQSLEATRPELEKTLATVQSIHSGAKVTHTLVEKSNGAFSEVLKAWTAEASKAADLTDQRVQVFTKALAVAAEEHRKASKLLGDGASASATATVRFEQASSRTEGSLDGLVRRSGEQLKAAAEASAAAATSLRAAVDAASSQMAARTQRAEALLKQFEASSLKQAGDLDAKVTETQAILDATRDLLKQNQEPLLFGMSPRTIWALAFVLNLATLGGVVTALIRSWH